MVLSKVNGRQRNMFTAPEGKKILAVRDVRGP